MAGRPKVVSPYHRLRPHCNQPLKNAAASELNLSARHCNTVIIYHSNQLKYNIYIISIRGSHFTPIQLTHYRYPFHTHTL